MIGVGIGIGRRGGLALTPEYKAVLAAMGTKPSLTDQRIQNNVPKNMVTEGLWAKCCVLDIFAMPTADASLINWKAPGTFNPSLINAPAFTAYEGYTGNNAGGKMLNSNFNPASHPDLVGQNNICVVIGVGSNIAQNMYVLGGYDGTRYIYLNPRAADDKYVSFINDATSIGGANTVGIAHFALSRGASGTYDKYINKTKSVVSITSTGLLNKEIGICGAIREALANVACDRQVRYFAIFSYLTETEIGKFIDIMEAYYA